MKLILPFQKRFSKRTALALVAVILVLLLRAPLLTLILSVQRPFSAVGAWMQNNTSLLFWNETGLRARVDVLERERAALAINRSEFEMLIEENTRLKSSLSFLESREWNFATAPIVAQNFTAHARRFVIGAGEEEGITVGAPAIVDDGILVGKVIATTAHSATVAELADAESATAVTLLNRTRTIGLAEGRAGALLLIRFIPHDEEVKQSDLVMTSGLEERVPSGLVVGIINSVRSDPSEPFKEAILEPLVDIRKYRMVSILLP